MSPSPRHIPCMSLPQQAQNLPLNALSSLGTQMNCPAPPQAPLGSTPPPSAGAASTGANLPPLQANQAGTPTPGPAQSTPPHTQPQTELPALPQPHPGTPVSTQAFVYFLNLIYLYLQFFTGRRHNNHIFSCHTGL